MENIFFNFLGYIKYCSVINVNHCEGPMNCSRNNFRNFLDLQFIIEQMYFMQFIQYQAIQHCFFGISLVPHSSISLSTYSTYRIYKNIE